MAKNKKQKKRMRSTRHLKRCKGRRNKKSRSNHKDRSYYIGKRRNAIRELRSNGGIRKSEIPWLGTIM